MSRCAAKKWKNKLSKSSFVNLREISLPLHALTKHNSFCILCSATYIVYLFATTVRIKSWDRLCTRFEIQVFSPFEWRKYHTKIVNPFVTNSINSFYWLSLKKVVLQWFVIINIIIMWCNTMPCNWMLCNAMWCNVMWRNAIYCYKI